MIKTKWTHFMDMHSGGGQKEKFAHCFIEAPEEEAKVIFYNRFGHSPERVTCTCCGEDYSISEEDNLEQATAHERGCAFAYLINGKEVPQEHAWQSGKGLINGAEHKYVERADTRWSGSKYLTLDEYLKSDQVKIIYASEITDTDRKGEVPAQGYVWVD